MADSIDRSNIDDILKKYGRKIEQQIGNSPSQNQANKYSKTYSIFKKEMAPEWNKYEKWCHSLGKIIKLRVSEKDEQKIKKYLEVAHLDIEPWQALTLGVMSFLTVFLLGIIASFSLFLISGTFPLMFFMLVTIFSLFLFYYVNGYPERLANKWRLKASSQMVPAILYIVVYMRHTSNLEKAISFASEHLEYPLSLDLKKVFYNVEISKFSTIKESLENYLESWRDYSPEFIEAFHLIESSLFEPNNERRISILEKSLEVILDGVHDKMLKFVHEIRSPVQNTYMLGTVLPVLGLSLLPLASVMVEGLLKTSHIFILYILIIPFLAFFSMNKYMMMRPGGYGETSLLERNPLYDYYKSRQHYVKSFLICIPLILIGLLPFIFQFTPVPGFLGVERDFTFSQIGLGFLGDDYFFGFIETREGVRGPFGAGALVMSLFIPLGIALFFSIAYRSKTKELIVERNKTKQLEGEFNNSLFQLGNRIGNGIPPELVFGKVAESSKGLRTEEFFRKVNQNIRQAGMSVEKAIFDKNRGAINYYPSQLISTSMRILIEASKKGLNIAAISLMSISQYVKNIQKINERLKDMLAETISDMKSNMTFLTPLLTGIVVGLAMMITSILNRLNLADLEGLDVGMGFDAFIGMFEITQMIPPYYLQIAIGIYFIQIIFILTDTLVTIDAGEDKLERTSQIGNNLRTGVIFYFIIALFAMIILYALSAIVLGGI